MPGHTLPDLSGLWHGAGSRASKQPAHGGLWCPSRLCAHGTADTGEQMGAHTHSGTHVSLTRAPPATPGHLPGVPLESPVAGVAA